MGYRVRTAIDMMWRRRGLVGRSCTCLRISQAAHGTCVKKKKKNVKRHSKQKRDKLTRKKATN